MVSGSAATPPLPGGRTVLGDRAARREEGLRRSRARGWAGCDARVRIVGEGPLRDSLREHRARRRSGARRVRAELERADVLAMPCVVAPDGDRDSMPVVVKEAMAMELMVVATDEVGLAECVRGAVGTARAARVTPAALRAALEEVLALGARRARRGGRRAARGCSSTPTCTVRPRAWPS